MENEQQPQQDSEPVKQMGYEIVVAVIPPEHPDEVFFQDIQLYSNLDF